MLRSLSSEEATRLERALRRMRRRRAAEDVVQLGAIVIRKQLVRCGKPRCRCSAAAEADVSPRLHGPYWYAWWWGAEGRKRSAYVGPAVRKERVEAQVRALEGLPLSREALQELAAVTEEELERGWAGESPGAAARGRLEAAVAHGDVQEDAAGGFPAEATIAWLEALGALGFRRRRRAGRTAQ